MKEDIKKPIKSKSILFFKPAEKKEIFGVRWFDVENYEFITRTTKKENEPLYILKKHREDQMDKTDETTAQIEAFNSLCYQLLLGKKAAKAFEVYGEDGKSLGVASKYFHGYIPLTNDMDKVEKGEISILEIANLYIKAGVGKIFAAGWIHEDDDMHGYNHGRAVNEDGSIVCVKIDQGRGTGPLSLRWYRTPIIAAAIKDSLEITKINRKDIECFPNITNRPQRWIGYEQLEHLFGQSDDFRKDAYYIFLKWILLDKEIFQHMASVTLEDVELQKQFAEHKVKKLEQFQMLKRTPSFREYVKNNPQLLEEILEEIKVYNLNFIQNEKYHCLLVNEDKLKLSYEFLIQDLQEQPLESPTEDIAFLERYLKEKQNRLERMFSGSSCPQKQRKQIEYSREIVNKELSRLYTQTQNDFGNNPEFMFLFNESFQEMVKKLNESFNQKFISLENAAQAEINNFLSLLNQFTHESYSLLNISEKAIQGCSSEDDLLLVQKELQESTARINQKLGAFSNLVLQTDYQQTAYGNYMQLVNNLTVYHGQLKTNLEQKERFIKQTSLKI